CALLPHLIECDNHVAPIAAAGCFHEIAKGSRSAFQRLANGKVCRRSECRRNRDGEFSFALPAEWECEVESGLGAHALAQQRGIQRNDAKTLSDDHVAMGLKARRQSPIHLSVREYFDVVIYD